MNRHSNPGAKRSGALDSNRGDNSRSQRMHYLTEVDRLATKLGRTPTLTEMNEDGAYHSATYDDDFDNWSDAVQQAGYQPVSHSSPELPPHTSKRPWLAKEWVQQRARESAPVTGPPGRRRQRARSTAPTFPW
ncbi:homing endonuclease associated repeat-containing protein [Halorhabdus rudnickae]|uniref:homing endonuclease associated repeat-containing protein n=1 Tax=Halorhabdus rudnickae TaxID=1775544 RepID=UPI0037447623